MSWANITVGQFLDLYKLSINKELDEMERVERAIGICYNLSDKQVEEIKMGEFANKSREAAKFLTDKIPGKPVKVIKAGGRKFKIIYDPTQLRQRQYVEITYFGKSPIENMHLIMASIVKPINKLGIATKNKVDDHPEVAEFMLSAPVVDVYHACVFFCKLYRNLINHTQASLVREIMETTTLTREEAEQVVKLSTKALDGFIQLPE